MECPGLRIYKLYVCYVDTDLSLFLFFKKENKLFSFCQETASRIDEYLDEKSKPYPVEFGIYELQVSNLHYVSEKDGRIGFDDIIRMTILDHNTRSILTHGNPRLSNAIRKKLLEEDSFFHNQFRSVTKEINQIFF